MTYELLYAEAQNDIKMLREKLAILEKRLAKAQENNDKCDGNVSCNTSMYEESQQIQNSDVGMSNGPYDGMSFIILKSVFFTIKMKF
jgi:hypothetical protein